MIKSILVTILKGVISMSNKTLKRSSTNKMLAGVCGGIAEYFDVSPLLIRILFLISGIGILPYILMAIFIPSDDE